MRKYDCQLYSSCLGAAALQNAPDLPCAKCKVYLKAPVMLTDQVLISTRALVAAIFSNISTRKAVAAAKNTYIGGD